MKLFEIPGRILNLFKKISMVQKIIIASILLTIVMLFLFIGKASSSKGEYPLYGVDFKIPSKDMQKIESSLRGMNISYTKDNDQIFVGDSKVAARVKAELGMNGLIPDGVKGWELFDNQPFTTTDFERKINVRRAITDSIKAHLELLSDIKSADVVISFGEEKYFQDDKSEYPLTASVVITPKDGSDIMTNKNKIRGLRDLIAKGVDELQPKNVVIMDSSGNVLTKNLEPTAQDENVQLAKEHLDIKEQERMKIYQELKRQLAAVFTDTRFDVKVNLELNWDVEQTKQHLILPTVIKQDNPNTPYDDSVVKDSITVSKKTTQENFKGQGYIPEGPAGIEDQVPPGLKEKMDRYNTYEKNETIDNEEFSKADKEITRQPYIISKVTVSVFLDGTWKKLRAPSGDYIFKEGVLQRQFSAVDQTQVRNVENSIRSLIGYDPNRGDAVSVSAVQFDRTKEFTEEDIKLFREQEKKKLIVAGVLTIVILFVLFVVLKAIRRELDRRRRLRAEELLRQQEALRLSSIKNSDSIVSMDVQKKDALNSQVIDMALDKPEETAKLLRTWLNSED